MFIDELQLWMKEREQNKRVLYSLFPHLCKTKTSDGSTTEIVREMREGVVVLLLSCKMCGLLTFLLVGE
jgi:hypothetical protein